MAINTFIHKEITSCLDNWNTVTNSLLVFKILHVIEICSIFIITQITNFFDITFKKATVFFVISKDSLLSITKENSFIQENNSSLDSTHSYIVEETAKLLQLNPFFVPFEQYNQQCRQKHFC